MSLHHHHHHHGPPTRLDNIVAPLLGGGLPLLGGLIFAPIGIHQLALGPPYMEAFGWAFTIIGVVLVIVGIVALAMLWPERKGADEQ